MKWAHSWTTEAFIPLAHVGFLMSIGQIAHGFFQLQRQVSASLCVFLSSIFEKNSIFSVGKLLEASTTFHRAIFGLQISKFFFFEWHHSQFPFWERPPKSLYKPPPFQPDWLSGHCPFSSLLYHSLLLPARDWRSTAVQKVASHYFSLIWSEFLLLFFLFCYNTVIMTVLFCFFSLLPFVCPSAPLYWGLFLCLVIVALALNPTLTLNPKPYVS